MEFDVLQYEPEPWTVQDCIAVSRLVAWDLALSWWTDVTFGDLVHSLPLAPCQKKQVVILDWDRREQAASALRIRPNSAASRSCGISRRRSVSA